MMEVIVGFCKCGTKITVEDDSTDYKDGKHSVPCPKCQQLYHFEVRQKTVLNKGKAKETEMICQDCKFRKDNHCLCPKMYENSGAMNPRHGVYINCSPSFTGCDYFEDLAPSVGKEGEGK